MKKSILMIISFLMIATMLVACAGKAPTYVFYASSVAAEGEGSSLLVDASKLTVKPASTKVFSFAKQTAIEKPSGVDDTRSFKINGQTYTAQYERSYTTDLAEGKLSSLGSLSRYDVNEDIRVEFRNKSGELVFFSDKTKDVRNVDGNMTKEQAKNYADAALLSIYGEDVQNTYKHSDTVYTDDGIDIKYSVVYSRYVYDYKTDDTIQITLNRKGDVIAVNAKKMGTFANAEKDMNKKDIEDAIAAARENLSDSWETSYNLLVVDSNGDYYVNMGLIKTDGKADDPLDETAALEKFVQLYVNIQ